MLTNLATNAAKYTCPGGRIGIALRTDGGHAVLTVADTGVGISPEMLPTVFDMYVQADRTLDRAQGGLGIGLALVRRLVELHGGTVAAASEGEGHVSTFTLRLVQELSNAASLPVSMPVERRIGCRRNAARGPDASW